MSHLLNDWQQKSWEPGRTLYRYERHGEVNEIRRGLEPFGPGVMADHQYTEHGSRAHLIAFGGRGGGLTVEIRETAAWATNGITLGLISLDRRSARVLLRELARERRRDMWHSLMLWPTRRRNRKRLAAEAET